MRELPSITGSTYATNAVNLAQMQGAGMLANLGQQQYMNQGGALQQLQDLARASPTQPKQKKEPQPMSSRRLVQVFIADPNENVPLESSVLYSGEQKLTDATDQELFFEVDIKSILEAHNAKRVTFIDRKVKERTEHLEPAKIRDLKMVVVTIATF